MIESIKKLKINYIKKFKILLYLTKNRKNNIFIFYGFNWKNFEKQLKRVLFTLKQKFLKYFYINLKLVLYVYIKKNLKTIFPILN